MSLNSYKQAKKELKNGKSIKYNHKFRYPNTESIFDDDVEYIENALFVNSKFESNFEEYEIIKFLYADNQKSEGIRIVVQNPNTSLFNIYVDRNGNDNGRISRIILETDKPQTQRMIVTKLGNRDGDLVSTETAIERFPNTENNQNNRTSSHVFEKHGRNLENVMKFTNYHIKTHSEKAHNEIKEIINEEQEIRNEQKSCLIHGFFKNNNIPVNIPVNEYPKDIESVQKDYIEPFFRPTIG